MDDNIAIRVKKLGKKYAIGGPQEKYLTLRDAIINSVKVPVHRVFRRNTDLSVNEFWALKEVSFDVHKGEIIGVIGRNGAGKSTLLKILSRITTPTEGEVEIHGRVGSLLEVGTGFHPELTGRENIFLNGSILGMKRAEIEQKFDEIVKFSEIEKFLDTPVKRYSSGMYVRLAFAVAAHLDTEILLVDEVLAVGDSAFQKKCLGKMGDVVKEGRTVLFVSHNMGAITNLCNKTILISNGKMVKYGESSMIVNQYISSFYSEYSSFNLTNRTDRVGSGEIIFTSIRLKIDDREYEQYLQTGHDAIIELDYKCKNQKEYHNIEIALGFKKTDQTPLLYLGSKINKLNIPFLKDSGTFICRIPRLPLIPGEYIIAPEIKQNSIISDYIDNGILISVEYGDFYGTGILWPFGYFLCEYFWDYN